MGKSSPYRGLDIIPIVLVFSIHCLGLGETVCSTLHFKSIEFDAFKIWIIYFFPITLEINRTT